MSDFRSAKRSNRSTDSINTTQNGNPHISGITPDPDIPPDDNNSPHHIVPPQPDKQAIQTSIPATAGFVNNAHSDNINSINPDCKQPEQSNVNQLPQNNNNNNNNNNNLYQNSVVQPSESK